MTVINSLHTGFNPLKYTNQIVFCAHFLSTAHTVTTTTRNLSEIFQKIVKNSPCCTRLHEFWNKVNIQIVIHFAISTTSDLLGIPIISKALKKCIEGDTSQKWIAYVKISLQIIIIWKLVCQIILLAIEVSKQISKITLSSIAIAACVGGLILHTKSWWKSGVFFNQFLKVIETDKKYTIQDYKKIQKYLSSNIKTLAKQLNVDEKSFHEAFQKRLMDLKIQNELTPLQNAELENIINILKNRLESNKHQKLISALSDAVNIIGNALIIASIAQPYFLTIWVTYSTFKIIGEFVFKQIQAYQFENNMKMINRSEEDSNLENSFDKLSTIQKASFKVKDFCRWYFCLSKIDTNIDTNTVETTASTQVII
jgi:hypothetical protein